MTLFWLMTKKEHFPFMLLTFRSCAIVNMESEQMGLS